MHDSNKPDDPPANLPTDIEQQVEELAERFLEELQAGKSPDREQWVKSHPQIAKPLAARLEFVEKLFRMVHGSGARGPRAANQNAPGPRAAAEHAGGPPTPHPREHAIHLKCPHCGNRIQLVEPKAQEVLCENCGSSFELAPGTTTTYRPDDLPKAIGRFQVLELLGRGGFGAVYKARDAELDRTVAIKVPRAGYFGTQQEQERFLREARNAARLKHPSIVPVHEIGHDRGVPYIVSDYVEGLTLADLLTAGRPTFRESAELVARIADALDYAHREKVIHRDIKPSNILIALECGGLTPLSPLGDSSPPSVSAPLDPVTSRSQSKAASSRRTPKGTGHIPFLTDFGLARRDDAEITVTLDGQILGTPAYMPPEQAAGDQRKVDARSDVYSLGVVLYELLTGELPFRGNKRMLLHQVLHDDPRPPRSLNDRIPHDLETICLKAMAKEPARRYPTARALADDLRRWLSGEPIHARSVGQGERLWRWCRRNPTVTALTVTILVIGLFGLSGIIWQWREAVGARLTAENRLVRIHVANGSRLMDEGDLTGSLVWFAEALRLDENNLARQRIHRTRIAAVLRQCPKLVQLIFHDGPVNRAEFSPNGRSVFTVTGNVARVWDVVSGEPTTPPLSHANHVNCASFSPDGSSLVTISGDGFDNGEARAWDASTGQPKTPVLKLPKSGKWVSFSQDGHRVLTTCMDVNFFDGEARVWNADTGEPVGPSLRHRRCVSFAAFSPDGSRVVTAAAAGEFRGQGEARVWDAVTGEPITPLLEHSDWVVHAAFSPDGHTVATGSLDRSARIWDATTGKPLTDPMMHKDYVNSVAFSPDGRFVVTASGLQQRPDGQGVIWDVITGSPTNISFRHQDGVEVAVFSPDGSRVLTAGHDRTARVWDANTGEALTPPLRHFGSVNSASFSSDGLRLVTGSSDGTVRVWDLAMAEEETPPMKHRAKVDSASFSPDGRSVVTASWDNTAGMWNAQTGQPITPLLVHSQGVRDASFSPDGRLVVTASWDRTAQVWDALTGKRVLSPLQHEIGVERASFSPDGRRLLTATGDHMYDPEVERLAEGHIWDASTGAKITSGPRHDRRLFAASFSPDGRRVVTAGSDDTAWIWDASTGAAVIKPLEHAGGVNSAAFSPDGRKVVTAGPTGTSIWDANSGKALGAPFKPSSGNWAVFSPDSNRVATAGGTARVWDASTGIAITPPLRHKTTVNHVSFSPDGVFVATSSQDKTARVWDAATGEEVTPALRHRDAVALVVFSPDGRRLLSASGDQDPHRGEARIFSLDLERRPLQDIVRLAELLSSQRISGGTGLVSVDAVSLREAWQTLRATYPEDFVRSPGYWKRRIHQEAFDRVAILCDKLLLQSDVLDAIRQDSTLSEELRNEALAEAARQPEDPDSLHEASWKLVDRPDANEAEYRKGLQYAEAASRLRPNDGNILNTLGVAQYRVGQYAAALESLTRSDKINSAEPNGHHPEDLAFLAMSQHQLGQPTEARALLTRLRQTLKNPRWANDADSQAFLREAEALIRGEKR